MGEVEIISAHVFDLRAISYFFLNANILLHFVRLVKLNSNHICKKRLERQIKNFNDKKMLKVLVPLKGLQIKRALCGNVIRYLPYTKL